MEGFVAGLKGGGYFGSESAASYLGKMRAWESRGAQFAGGGGDTNIGSLTINTASERPDDVKRAVSDGIQAERERNGKRIARTIPEGAGAFS